MLYGKMKIIEKAGQEKGNMIGHQSSLSEKTIPALRVCSGSQTAMTLTGKNRIDCSLNHPIRWWERWLWLRSYKRTGGHKVRGDLPILWIPSFKDMAGNLCIKLKQKVRSRREYLNFILIRELLKLWGKQKDCHRSIEERRRGSSSEHPNKSMLMGQD